MFKTYFEYGRQSFVVFSLRDLLSCLNHVPKFQRILDEEHASVLYRAFENSFLDTRCLELVGEISLGRHDDKDIEYQILDGQHRYTCLKKLFETYPDCGDILVQVKLYTGPDEYLRDIYTFINSNKKVEMYRNIDTTTIYNEVQRFFRDKYPSYLSTSNKPQVPRVNIDRIASELDKRDIVSKLNITDSDTLIDYIKDINEYYQSVADSEWRNWKIKGYDRISDMGSGKKLMLGLYPNFEWMDRMIKKHQDKIEYRTMVPHKMHTPPKPNSSKKVIPVSKRDAVWNKRNPNGLNGLCYTCGDELQYKNFHVSHIVASALGGSDEISNLEPCCQSCNLNMGTMNLNDYRNYCQSTKAKEDNDSE